MYSSLLYGFDSFGTTEEGTGTTMTTCAINKIDSNVTGLSFAEEDCLKVLPGVSEANAIWYDLEPNSYSDFGGDITTVARNPIDPGRQNKKGTTTGLDATGGFNIDVTQTNMQRLLQGFYFADAREKPQTKPLNGTQSALASVSGTLYTFAAGPTFLVSHLILASGFGIGGNNGLKKPTAVSGTTVTAPGLTAEASPPAASMLEAVGAEFAAADVAVVVNSGIPSLSCTAGDFTIYGLTVGEWVYVGGDAVGSKFVNNAGYARIKTIAAKLLTFDDTTWTPVAEAATGITLRIFFGTVIRNEKTPSLIKRRSYNFERTLGMGANDIQAEYLIGAVANEFTLNMPQADKLNADLTFVACDNVQRSGDVGDLRKVGTHISALGQDALNTSVNMYRVKLNILDPTTSKPTPMFGFVQEANVSISNNVSGLKALGVMGNFDTTAGNFTVGGSLTVYFATTAAIKAVRNNADCAFNVIIAAKNAGQVYDVPLLGLGGGRANVEKDTPITLGLEPAGAENVNGYTMMQVWFEYLPNAAMPA